MIGYRSIYKDNSRPVAVPTPALIIDGVDMICADASLTFKYYLQKMPMPPSDYNYYNYFNLPVNIGDNVSGGAGLFYPSPNAGVLPKYPGYGGPTSNYNQPVKLGNNINNCCYMFYSQWEFNYPITVNYNLQDVNCFAMFGECRKFNSPVTISRCSNVSNMFYHAYNMNLPVLLGVDFPSHYTNAIVIKQIQNNINIARLFEGCNNYNQPIVLSAQVGNCAGIMVDCNQFSSNIYFTGNTYSSWLNVRSLLSGTNNSKRRNVFFNVVLNNKFNQTQYNAIINPGSTGVTWTTMTNGFYNSTYNVYCYYNYDGVSDPF